MQRSNESVQNDTVRHRPLDFEYEVGNHVFDLALLDVRLLIEFDGPYHAGAQLEADTKKDAVAMAHGFSVIRRSVPSATIIDPCVIEGF